MDREKIKNVAKKNAGEFLKKKNVIGVGAGEKWKSGKTTNKEAVVVLVEKKVDLDELEEQDLLPKEVDEEGEAVPVDVIQVGKLKPRTHEHQFNHRPMVAGISCGHFAITAGTLGLFVEKNGLPHILSNNHVLANSNLSSIGDAILQPGPIDGGRTRHEVATLSDVAWISFTRANLVDAALAKVIGHDLPEDEAPVTPPAEDDEKVAWYKRIWRKIIAFLRKLLGSGKEEAAAMQSALAPMQEAILFSNTMLNMPEPITGELVDPAVGMMVQKSGRTTGYTTGTIIAVGTTVEVEFGTEQPAMFEDQIITSDMSAGGDSGSAVFDMNGNAVGLLFAGSDTVTILNPMKTVFKVLGIDRIWR